MVTMFTQINSLPGSQIQLTVGNRHTQYRDATREVRMRADDYLIGRHTTGRIYTRRVSTATAGACDKRDKYHPSLH